MKTIKVKELEVPVDAMAEVAEILAENEITNTITGVDDDHEVIFIEVEFGKEEKEFIHVIERVIEDHRD